VTSYEEEENDWQITEDGLYIATRGFLSRRGYCCANRCRNCPYINWRDNSAWQPIAGERIQRLRVSAKAIAGAQAMLHNHQHMLKHGSPEHQEYHCAMAGHYQRLLERWEAN
jgi:Family of unknown function (DUF5522)